MDKNRNTGSKNSGLLQYLLVFFLMMVTGILLFQIKKIAPYGTNALLNMDLWGQYFPMYVQQSDIQSLPERFYSFKGALGYNNWAQAAYYTNSPSLLLLALFPFRNMIQALNWICIIKISLSSVTCLAYLRRHMDTDAPVLMGSAAAYGLCGYALAFMTQPMWTDTLVIVPLVLIGLDALIFTGKSLFYCIMLAICILSDFYIGFAVCIFCVLYFAVHSAGLFYREKGEDRAGAGGPEKTGLKVDKAAAADSEESGMDAAPAASADSEDSKLETVEAAVEASGMSDREKAPAAVTEPARKGKRRICGTKAWGSAALRFMIFSLLAGGISAVVIYPVWKAISQTIASDQTAQISFIWYSNIFDWLHQLLPGQKLCLGYKGANIYTGLFVLLLIPLYFLNREISAKKKAGSAVLLILMYLSMNFRPLDYIWHGFHFPNQLPGRWVFLFSLVLVSVTGEGLVHYRGIRLLSGTLSVFLGTALFLFLGFSSAESGPSGADYALLAVGTMLLILITALVHRLDEKASCEKIIRRLLVFFACLQVVSSGYNFIRVAGYKEGGLGISDKDLYERNMLKQHTYGETWQNKSEEFYRIQPNPKFTFNSPMLGDYNGIDYYSSTMNGAYYYLMQFLGNDIYAKNVSIVYNFTSPVQNSLFGIRYFMDYAKNLENKCPGRMHVAEESDDAVVWENEQALPIGFGVSDRIADFEVTDEIRCIDNQNKFVRAITGSDTNVYEKMRTSSFRTENCSLTDSGDWNNTYYNRKEDGDPVRIYYEYECGEDGPVFLESNFRDGTLTVKDPKGTQEISCKQNRQVYLGEYIKGDQISITFESKDIFLGLCGLNLFRYNDDRWEEIYQDLSAQGFETSSVSNTRMDGTIRMDQEGYVLFSIIQDGGWKVYCDGSEVPSDKIGGALLAAPVPAGSHELSIRYSVPGLKAGAVLSVISVVLLIFLAVGKGTVTRPLKKFGRGSKGGSEQDAG